MHEIEQAMPEASMRTWIEQLTAIPMVCGFERAQSERVRELFAPLCDEIEVDRFGNVIGRIRSGKPDAKTVLLDAHLDQIGFVVTETLDHGFLRFQSVGGVDPRMLLGAEATIGGGGTVRYCCLQAAAPAGGQRVGQGRPHSRNGHRYRFAGRKVQNSGWYAHLVPGRQGAHAQAV